ncbi:MAG: formate--tetrahydrofolate ligase [Erysipelotrichaceae bacterium]
MKTDIQIAQEASIEDISLIANKAKINKDYLEVYGKHKAKVDLSILNDLQVQQDGKLILVTAISPTKAGEGKSTTTIGLVDGLASLNKNVLGCLREPSLGPVFGLKGGATGGGYAQVIPMEDINLHFTGDIHAITTANNLISALLDNSIYQENPLNIDPEKVVWNRCLDCNDRTLRTITIAQKAKVNGVEREDHFNITVASEIMAILCLSNDLNDFVKRVREVIVAYTYDNIPVYVKDLKIEGSLAVVMKDALKPNLVQTLENTPILIHGGPFANIAHGCNSIIATKMALKLADYVVTEAGFGADLGAEKFLDIKCRKAEIKPNAVVIVATIRALKMHGGVAYDQLSEENVEALEKGICNLEKHIDSIKHYNVPYIVAINKFTSDSEKEVRFLQNYLNEQSIPNALSNGWAQGSKGMQDLSEKVISLCNQPNEFDYLYSLDSSVEDKILTITKKIYGGKGVVYSEQASQQIEKFVSMGYGNLPICMAKTPVSLSDNEKLLGRPTDFDIHVQEVKLSAGAGFLVVLTGKVMTMPGLPKVPAALGMGVDEKGNSYGIF